MREIGQHADSEQGLPEVAVRPRHEAGELGLRLDRGDLGEVGLQRRRVELLEPGLVHVALVERAQLAVGGRGHDDRAQLLLVAVRQLRSDSVLRFVGGDLVRVEPFARGVALEVVARVHRQVARRNVDAPGAVVNDVRHLRAGDQIGLLGLRGRRAGKNRSREQERRQTN